MGLGLELEELGLELGLELGQLGLGLGVGLDDAPAARRSPPPGAPG